MFNICLLSISLFATIFKLSSSFRHSASVLNHILLESASSLHDYAKTRVIRPRKINDIINH